MMTALTTATLWLLMSTQVSYSAGASVATVARFTSLEECQRVLKVVEGSSYRFNLRCVQANVVVEGKS